MPITLQRSYYALNHKSNIVSKEEMIPSFRVQAIFGQDDEADVKAASTLTAKSTLQDSTPTAREPRRRRLRRKVQRVIRFTKHVFLVSLLGFSLLASPAMAKGGGGHSSGGHSSGGRSSVTRSYRSPASPSRSRGSSSSKRSSGTRSSSGSSSSTSSTSSSKSPSGPPPKLGNAHTPTNSGSSSTPKSTTTPTASTTPPPQRRTGRRVGGRAKQGNRNQPSKEATDSPPASPQSAPPVVLRQRSSDPPPQRRTSRTVVVVQQQQPPLSQGTAPQDPAREPVKDTQPSPACECSEDLSVERTIWVGGGAFAAGAWYGVAKDQEEIRADLERRVQESKKRADLERMNLQKNAGVERMRFTIPSKPTIVTVNSTAMTETVNNAVTIDPLRDNGLYTGMTKESDGTEQSVETFLEFLENGDVKGIGFDEEDGVYRIQGQWQEDTVRWEETYENFSVRVNCQVRETSAGPVKKILDCTFVSSINNIEGEFELTKKHN